MSSMQAFVGANEDFNARMHVLESSDKREVANFFKGNCTTAGLSINYAVNLGTREVVAIYKTGKLVQRDVAGLIAEGFTGWMYSWAWAPKTFEINGERVGIARELEVDGCVLKTAIKYRSLFGK